VTTSSPNPDDLEIVPGFQHEKLQGWVPTIANDEDLKTALEKAFDYRGDIRITCKDGAVIDGYLYDRRQGKTLADSMVRVLPSDGGARVSIPYAEIVHLGFSDRDPAAGKSWEAWVKKYWERKEQGQTASIDPEHL
jgi:hypothetical protein